METNEFKNFKKYVIDNLNRLDPNSEEFKLKESEVFNQLNEISPDKNGKYFYALARDVKGINIDECLNYVIENSLDIYKFAKDVEGVNIKKCEDFIINIINNTKDKWNRASINNIKYGTFYVFDESVYNKKNYEILADFAGNIEGADIERIKNIIPSHQHDKYGLEKNIEKVKINEFSNIFKYKFEN